MGITSPLHYIFIYLLITDCCNCVLFHQQSGQCDGYSLSTFTSNVMLACIKKCYDSCMCGAVNIQSNNDDAAPAYSCELLQFPTEPTVQDQPGSYQSSHCFSMYDKQD